MNWPTSCSTAPEAVDLSTEDAATLDMYGINNDRRDFGTRCLMARSLFNEVSVSSSYTAVVHTTMPIGTHGV